MNSKCSNTLLEFRSLGVRARSLEALSSTNPITTTTNKKIKRTFLIYIKHEKQVLARNMSEIPTAQEAEAGSSQVRGLPRLAG